MAAFGVTALRVTMSGKATRRFGAWLTIALGFALFVMYEADIDRDPFVLVIGLACVLLGAHEMEVSRLEERIRRLETELREDRSAV
jgi:hypothetical protein